ncbi:MAG: hypothetical protein Q7V04_10515 [Deltaproteobacteria bacterium]|nr:hypothetical protein [Deltaproteobacteria bacterium]
MNTRKLLVPVLCIVLFLALQMTAWGAAVPTATQTFSLNPGWNAVYLEVQPLSSSPAVVFKDLPVGSRVWAWQGKQGSVQFIQDPGEAPVNNPRWLAIFTSAAESSLNNLYAISANNAYLVHVKGSSQVNINIEGRPTIRHKEWIPDSFNLTGFGFASTPPTFATFFALSNSHKNQAVYRLNNTSGAWEIVNNPATTSMRSGEAFWVFCQSGSDYQGPLTVEANGSDGLDFGAGITILSLTLKNASTIDRTVAVSQLAATSPVALDYRNYDVATGKIRLYPLSGMPAVTVKAGASAFVNLAVRRKDFSGSAASVLEFSDAQGSRVRVPVSAVSNPVNSYPGLWTGTATLSKVSQLTENGTTPPFAPGAAKETPAKLNLNLILHQDKNGQARLLKQAILMFRDATYNSVGTPLTNGRPVVLTKDSLIPLYSGVTQRDGSKVGRRFSAVGFDYSPSADATHGTDFDATALKCSGSISTTVNCRIVLESSASFTQPTNPFLHRYHPDHDNLASDFTTYKQEVNRIERDITLVFDSTPVENPTIPPPGWGVTVLGGTYTELISDLAKGAIRVEGNFTLNLAADVDLLNE